MRYLSLVLLTAIMSCTSCAALKADTMTAQEPDKIFKKIVETNIETVADPEVITPRKTDSGFRHLKLVGEVNANSVRPLIDELQTGADFKGFILELNTPGGSVDDGFLLAKAMEDSGKPVHCIVDGEAMSMGYYILQSCTTRFMTKRSVLMIHGPSLSGNISGNTNKMQEMTDSLSALNKAMIEQYVARLRISKKELMDKIAVRAWFLNWDEALKIGAIDGTMKNYAGMLSMAKSWKPADTARPNTQPK